MIRVDLDVEVDTLKAPPVFGTVPGDMAALRNAVKDDIVEALQEVYMDEPFIMVIGHRRNDRSRLSKRRRDAGSST